MKPQHIFLCYGEGGHKAEMEKLLQLLLKSELNNAAVFIGVSEGRHGAINGIKNHSLFPLRDKYKLFTSFLLLPFVLPYNFFKSLILIIKYHPVGIISTGPGTVLLPAILFKLFNKKIIFIENSSRIDTASITGKIMYRIAHKFYVQNIELLNLYPAAIYGGLL